ncbi:unnamed protein product [Ostreobium quekettii]|uniref:Translation initiation factor eIF2B subunit delta n=1 Tax=Ostreobium quekettii TaxID=121088 RepID=A0A8S1IKC1_9CHLO|nr:unnamed protein product [Ostreobium quekettii]|eukprot:evm.model.scf_531.5 EVM.evm.TU.scf_531.5   scf_531:30543-34842(-)
MSFPHQPHMLLERTIFVPFESGISGALPNSNLAYLACHNGQTNWGPTSVEESGRGSQSTQINEAQKHGQPNSVGSAGVAQRNFFLLWGARCCHLPSLRFLHSFMALQDGAGLCVLSVTTGFVLLNSVCVSSQMEPSPTVPAAPLDRLRVTTNPGTPAEIGAWRSSTPFAESALRRSLEKADVGDQVRIPAPGDVDYVRPPSAGTTSPSPLPCSPSPAQPFGAAEGQSGPPGLQSQPSLTSMVAQQAAPSPQPQSPSPHAVASSNKEMEKTEQSGADVAVETASQTPQPGQRTPKAKHTRKDSDSASQKAPKASAATASVASAAAEKSGEKQQKSSKKTGAKPAQKGAGKQAGSGGIIVAQPAMLFGHLQEYKQISKAEVVRRPGTWELHPAILQLGLQFADGTVRGGNARTAAMLEAFVQVVQDFRSIDGTFQPRELTAVLSPNINFLVECRPLNMSMKNAIKHVKLRISKVDPGIPLGEGISCVEEMIRQYAHERITDAVRALSQHAAEKVRDGDVILTFSWSNTVMRVLKEAKTELQRSFRVVVVDSRPELDGQRMLQDLVKEGISCTYAYVNAISCVMKEATKVVLGASAVLSNGRVVGRLGTAAVAMMAHAHNVPVIVTSETCKFHDQVQLDSFTQNELGDPNMISTVETQPHIDGLKGWQDKEKLSLLNLKYDLMPAEYVNLIVTELGMIPTTSVQVILREYKQES